jgi:hypothetical protein
MYKLYEHLKNEKICLSYLGVITDSVTIKFIDLSDFFLKNSAHLSKLKNRTSFLIVECFQNTIRHRDKDAQAENHKDYFQINAWDGGMVLSSCNLIPEKEVEELRRKITYINSLNPDELKKLHEEILVREELSSKGGGGLGLIDMARKTGLPLRYNFTPLKSNVSEFFMALEILNPNESVHAPKISLYLKKELEFYKTLVQKNILLLFRGEFSKETVQPLIEMMEHNFATGDNVSSSEKRRLITIIEVLQNISKHGKIIGGAKNGIFSIAEVNGKFIIECGNFIEKKDEKPLRESAEMVKKLNMEEITALYKKRLSTPDISAEGNSGLGLLEIARNSLNQFTYEFTETPEKEIFFSIKITLQ